MKVLLAASDARVADSMHFAMGDVLLQIHGIRNRGENPVRIRVGLAQWREMISSPSALNHLSNEAWGDHPKFMGVALVIDALWDGPIAVETRHDHKPFQP